MFWENYRALCKGIGKSPNKVAAESGISSGSVTAWKKKGIIPRISSLEKIADYFGVEVRHLLSKAPAKVIDVEQPSVEKCEVFFMETLNKIFKLLEKQEKQQKDLTDYLGLHKNAATDWKSGKSKSYRKLCIRWLPESDDLRLYEF